MRWECIFSLDQNKTFVCLFHQPKMYSIALVTMPEFLLGVLTMPETSCSLWAALNDWVNGLMDRLWWGPPAKLEFKLITDVSWLLVCSRIWDAFTVASKGGSRHGLTPTMRLPPKILPVRPSAFWACIFVWKRIFIQLPFGGIWCCKIVPPEKKIKTSDFFQKKK